MRVPQFIKDLLPLCGILGICLIYLQKVVTYSFDRSLSGAMVKFAGLSYSDWGMLFVLGGGVLLYKDIRAVMFRPLFLAVCVVSVLSVGVGASQTLYRNLLFNDIRITLSFICGFIFALMLRRSRIWHWHLLLLQACLLLLMLKGYRDATFGEVFVAGLSGGGRTAINSVASLTGASLVVVSLMITFASLRFWAILPLALSLLLPVFYMGVIASGTRSVLLIFFVAIGCALFVRAYGRGGRGLDKFPSMTRLITLGVTASLFAGLFVYRYRSFLYEQALLFISRFKGEGMADESSSLRVLEVQALFDNMGFLDWIWGKGAGGVFASPIYDGGFAPTVHIGLFTFLLKFGLPVFLAVVVLFYMYIPWRFARSVISPLSDSKRRREAIMVVFPCMIPLIGALSLSGGYGTGAMIWWGVSYGCYLCLERDGLESYAGQIAASRGRIQAGR